MILNDFVSKEPRALPIFVLADTSGSMSGEKINALNLAMREMLGALKNLKDIRGMFQVAVISFGGNTNIIQPLSNINAVSLTEMSAGGNTPMGEAFELLHTIIEDKNIVSSRSYIPTIVLISDGQPTDFNASSYQDWEPMQKLLTGARSAKCQRLAMGIGEDANIEMLKAFVNNPEIPVIKAKDASGIAAFFRWVTMSVSIRMNSVNPNAVSAVVPIFDFDSEEIYI